MRRPGPSSRKPLGWERPTRARRDSGCARVGEGHRDVQEPSRQALSLCFVLHRREYRNTSLLVEVFATDSGRFPAIARGAKGSRSVPASLLQPFQPVWLGWIGQGEVKTLRSAEAAGPALELDSKALVCGFYLNELLMRLLGRNDPHEGLFGPYAEALTWLARGADPAQGLRRFELLLLRELGYGPLLEAEADSGVPIRANRRYDYELERGPIPLPLNGGGTGLVSGRTLLGLASGEALGPQESREARELLRRLLGRYLGERPLKSRELFRQWRAD